MKARTLIMIAAVAMLTTGCHRVCREFKELTTYPSSANEVAKRAQKQGCDAALVVTVADTQYVLYRENTRFSKRGDARRCFVMRYVLTDYPNEWTSRGGEFRLEEPQQPVVLTRRGDNALTLTVDSVTLSVDSIAATDSAIAFRFGFDAADRPAVLYLYGKAADTDDPFAETTIQQMLTLALSLDVLMDEWDSDIDTAFVEAGEAMEDTERTLADAERELEESMAEPSALGWAQRYAEYLRMDSVAGALGFRDKSATADDDRIKLEVTGSFGRQQKCYDRMERMGKAAAESRCRVWSVGHSLGHRSCKFTIEWY